MSAHAILNARPAPVDVDGVAMVPLSYVHLLEEQLRDDMRAKSDLRGYMKAVRELWDNIPESQANKPYAKSSEVFRKWALINTGWANVDTIIFDTEKCARRNAATLHYRNRMVHGYAITRVRENIIESITPQSQSFKEMGKEDFKQSKDDVLTYMRGVIGVE